MILSILEIYHRQGLRDKMFMAVLKIMSESAVRLTNSSRLPILMGMVEREFLMTDARVTPPAIRRKRPSLNPFLGARIALGHLFL